jgi:hypothetical protein
MRGFEARLRKMSRVVPGPVEKGALPRRVVRAERAAAATLAALLLAVCGTAHPALAQSCTIPEQCTGQLTTGACGYAGTNCSPPPAGGMCSSNGVGSCSGTWNCTPPIATVQGVQILPAGNGTYTARLPIDVVAPFNSWAAVNYPNSALQVFWYAAAAVPDICNSSTASSLCSFSSVTGTNPPTGADHVLTWLDETGLTCAGAPYSFTVSALVSTCQQPSCFCEQVYGSPYCVCNASTATTLNWLTINVTKSMIPGCGPPPDFCAEAGGAGCASPTATMRWLVSGSTGNPDS